jgi:hypothetical protein
MCRTDDWYRQHNKMKEAPALMSRMKRGVLWFTTLVVLALAALTYSAFTAVNRHRNTLRLVEVVKKDDKAYEAEVRALLAGGGDPNASLTPTPFTMMDMLRAIFHLSQHRDLGESLVMHAAGSCNDVVLGDLLDAGGDRNTLYDGQTTLVKAILSGRHRNVEVLVQHGADLNLSGPNGGTPLYAATADNDLKDVSLLLAHGADPNGPINTDGMTPLMLAASLERTKVIEALLRAGAKVNTRMKDGMSVLDFAHDHDAAEDAPGKRRQAEVSRLLLQAGAKE